jgi:transcriptional regulator with XRE-family HTH domain
MPDPNYAFVRERLKKTRERRSLNLRQVEAETGVSATTLSRIERGATTPDLDTLNALIDWLQLDGNDVFNVAPATSDSTPTPERVRALLRADPKLDSQTAQALARVFETAYTEFADNGTTR